jgi:5-methylcytosine-specific restriction endonuclease McrA
VYRAVRQRDGGRCRCCGRVGQHVHHIRFRSHGGACETSNLVLLCWRCHDSVHRRRLVLRGVDGAPADGDAVVRFDVS